MNVLEGLKVCFIAGTLGPGGAERQLYYLTTTLKRAGAEPSVVSLTSGEYWERPLRAAGIPVQWVGRRASRFARLITIVSAVRRLAPDIVQSQHFFANLYGVAAARAARCADIGGVRSNLTNELEQIGRILGRLSLRLPRVLAFNSRAAMRTAVRLGVANHRTRFLPNVVDTTCFSADPSKDPTISVLAVGRFTAAKRFDRLIRVIAKLKEGSPRFCRAVIAGDGPLRSDLERRARECGLTAEEIEFPGVVDDVAALYRESRLLVCCSDFEGTPNVVLEAMASGVPVVSTDVGDVATLIDDGCNGFLVPPRREDVLFARASELIQNDALHRRFSHSARSFVERERSLSALSDQLSTFYGSL